MKYIKTFEDNKNDKITGRYLLEQWISVNQNNIFRIWEISDHKNGRCTIKELYTYSDGELRANNVKNSEFLITEHDALSDVVFQSNNLEEVLDQMNMLLSVKKYNL